MYKNISNIFKILIGVFYKANAVIAEVTDLEAAIINMWVF